MLRNHTVRRQSRGNRRKTMDGFEKEFLQLCNLRPRFSIGNCAAGHRKENRQKNRQAVVVPPDERRPYLTSFQNTNCSANGDGGGDYINAVFIDGFTSCREMICTESPMSNTIANFWAMVYDHDVTSIVVLDTYRNSISSELGHSHFGRFWPVTPNPITHGNMFSVAMKKHSVVEGCCEAWDLDIRKVGLLANSKSLPDISNCIDFKSFEPKPVTLFSTLCLRGDI